MFSTRQRTGAKEAAATEMCSLARSLSRKGVEEASRLRTEEGKPLQIKAPGRGRVAPRSSL